MAQYTWTLAHGDTLPAIAEACGHPGEWTLILESAPWLAELDYTMLGQGTPILLPEGWSPPGAEPTDADYPPPREAKSSSSRSSSSSKDD